MWLEKKWSKKVAVDFVTLLYDKIHRLSATPYTGIPAKKAKNVRKLVITKYNVVYYRIKGNTITVLTLFETRQNPKKNKYE